MKVKDLIPYLPRFSDNSGFDVKIAFHTHGGRHTDTIMMPDENWAPDKFSIYPFQTVDQIYNAEVESIQAGRPLRGGGFDDALIIYTNLSK